MRTILILSVALFGIGWVAANVPAEQPPKSASDNQAAWRRTAHGWERATWTQPRVAPYEPTIHPLAVAGFQLWLVVAAITVHAWIEIPASTRGRLAQNSKSIPAHRGGRK